MLVVSFNIHKQSSKKYILKLHFIDEETNIFQFDPKPMFFLQLFGWEFAVLEWEIVISILPDVFEIRSENTVG